MPARIEDVAATAGVSMKTVSRVFNNEPNVREKTRARVEAAAKALNYRPNPSARSLAGNRSYLISLVYDDPAAASSYIMEIIVGMLAACENSHYSAMLRPLEYASAGHISGNGRWAADGWNVAATLQSLLPSMLLPQAASRAPAAARSAIGSSSIKSSTQPASRRKSSVPSRRADRFM